MAKFVRSRLKAISKCENQRSSGKLPPATVCRPQCSTGSDNAGAPCFQTVDCPNGTCAAPEAATAARLDKIRSKADTKVVGACGPVSPLPPIGAACATTTTGNELEFCAIADPLSRRSLLDPTLNQPHTADTLAQTIYDAAAPVDPTLRSCQSTISKAVATYLKSRVKAELKCQELVTAGALPGPCPDASTAALLETARVKLDGAIRNKCTEAQLAANSAPQLTFGVPCERYKLVTFDRDGMTNNNSLPVTDRLIRCLTDATAAVADRAVDLAYPGAETSAFVDGVAAGDATDSAAIFWTRLPDSTTGGFLDVTTDVTFGSGVQTVPVTSPAGADGTVKQEVTLLSPFTTYFYRFRQGAETSATGAVKTTPAPADTQTLRIGWSGDSNAYFRPYTVLDPLRLLAPDAWFFIGDTIYGDDPRADGVDAMTTAEYFAKYRMNRADGPLRHLLASTGTYTMWDDHEVRNDFAGAVPAFATRMASGNYAFRRYDPLREDGGDPTRLYRSFKFGTLAEFFLIDLRQYRSAKYTCCNDPMESGYVTTDDDTTCHMSGDLVIPDMNCTDALATPGRTVLGATQKAWLENALATSTATFKFIMNGPPITNLVFQPYDFWIGYPEERDEILGYILDPNGDMDQSDRIPNVIWLSTDLHGIVISAERVSVGSSQPVPEVVGGAIGMDPIFRELPPGIIPLLGTLPSLLTQITQFDLDRFNVALLTVAPGAPATARVDFYDRSGAVIQSITFDAS